MALNEEIGMRICKKREKLNITQQQLSDKIGVSRSKIAKMEVGEREIKAQDILQIASTLGTTCDYLITGIETNNIEICDELNLSNDAVSTLRQWKKDLNGVKGKQQAHEQFTALEALICSEEGKNILGEVYKYLTCDFRTVYVYDLYHDEIVPVSTNICFKNFEDEDNDKFHFFPPKSLERNIFDRLLVYLQQLYKSYNENRLDLPSPEELEEISNALNKDDANE